MAGGISIGSDPNFNPAPKPLASFQPTSPFSPANLRQPPPTQAAALVNGALAAADAQAALAQAVSAPPPPQVFQPPPFLPSQAGAGVTILQNPAAPAPAAPPAAAAIGDISTPPAPAATPAPSDLTAAQLPNLSAQFAATAGAFATAAQSAQATSAAVQSSAGPAPAKPAEAPPAPTRQTDQNTAPLSPQAQAAGSALQAEQAKSEVTSQANEDREAQIRADAARAALQAQLEAAQAAAATRRAQLDAAQAAALQNAAAGAGSTLAAVATNGAPPPSGTPVLTVSDAAGNVLFRRPATSAEVEAARAAADQALREAQAALARLAADQAAAGQPLGLDPPKGDVRTVDPRVAAEFAATSRDVPAPVPEAVPAFVIPSGAGFADPTQGVAAKAGLDQALPAKVA